MPTQSCSNSGLHTIYNMLESIKRSEVLVVQWEIQDILEELIPPDAPEEEEEDDPTKRPLRESEIQMVAQGPQQGLVLFKSKVDTRWVLMQIDPYTGQLMGKQDLIMHVRRSLQTDESSSKFLNKSFQSYPN